MATVTEPYVLFYNQSDGISIVVMRGEKPLVEWVNEEVVELERGGHLKFEDEESVLAYCRTVGLLEI